MTDVNRNAIAIGIAIAMILFAAMRGLDLVPRTAGMTALAGGAAVAALADIALGGRARARLADRALFGRVAVAVTCPLAVVLATAGPVWDPALLGGLAFAVGLGAGWAAVAARRRAATG